MTDASRQRMRRRIARTLGVVGVLTVVVAMSIAGTGAKQRARRAAAPERKPPLPEGCKATRVQKLRPQSYDGPRSVLQTGRDYRAVVDTSCGELELDLFEQEAPVNVNNFVFLAARGFYDGLPFHRIEKDSVLQTGDPNGRSLDPPDGPGYVVADELANAHFDRYVYGVIGMANRGPDTAGSQFFIVVHDLRGARQGDPEPAGYRPRYTIIGRVARKSWETLERIAEVDTQGGKDPVKSVRPIRPVVIRSIELKGRRLEP